MHTLGLFWGEWEAINRVGFCVPFPILHWGKACYLSAGYSPHFLMYLYVLWSKEIDVQFNCRCPRSGSIALLSGGEVEVS